jgi:hypothetical protein
VCWGEDLPFQGQALPRLCEVGEAAHTVTLLLLLLLQPPEARPKGAAQQLLHLWHQKRA